MADESYGTPTKREDAVVFIDIDSYFRGTRECFGAKYLDVNVQALATELAEICNTNLIRAYSYFSVPPADRAPDRNAIVRNVMAKAESEWSIVRAYDEHSVPRLQVDAGGRPFASARVLDHSFVHVGMAIDAIDELMNYESGAFIFMSREAANSHLASRIHEIVLRERLFVRMYSATCKSGENKPPIINGTDWVYVNRDVYDRCRLLPGAAA